MATLILPSEMITETMQRLPRTGGIDVTTYNDKFCLYVPRHSRVTFVPELDYLSGLGYHPARKYGTGPIYLVSDLGEFDFITSNEASGLPRMRLTSNHPGVSIEKIQAKTGFELLVSPIVSETIPPQRNCTREMRRPARESGGGTTDGGERRTLLHQIITKKPTVTLQ
jgi:hypothetical protein